MRILWLIAAAGFSLAEAASLTGTVFVAEGGKPPIIKVSLFRLGGGLGGAEPKDTTSTDSLGRFRFKNPGVGHWRLTAEPPGYHPVNAAASIDDSLQEATADLVLRKGSGLSKTGAVTGLVRDASSGKPLRGATLALTRLIFPESTGTVKGLPVDTARSDSLGRYVLDSVDFRVDYLITASAQGYAPVADSAVAVAVEQTLTKPIELQKDKGKAKGRKAAGRGR